MPIYVYKCRKCLEEFEEIVKNADETVTCHGCSSHSCDRLMSGAPTFILKGGGWASDGYSSSPKKDAPDQS